jgi:large subunit ribosomal protein L13
MVTIVIIINAEKAALSGNKYQDKMYYRHSNYPVDFAHTAMLI